MKDLFEIVCFVKFQNPAAGDMIRKAVRLLRSKEERLTVLDIALRCGFNNTANFNKAFKKQKGITPGELQSDPRLLSH